MISDLVARNYFITKSGMVRRIRAQLRSGKLKSVMVLRKTSAGVTRVVQAYVVVD